MASGGKKGGKKAKVSDLQKQMDERRKAINRAYNKAHPQRAAEERGLRQSQAMAAQDFGHKRNGTVETHAKAGKVRQGALARLHTSGAISIDHVGWAEEIKLEHDLIDAEVSVRTVNWGTRVDVTRSGQAAFFESLGRVRRAVAYTRWRAELAPLCNAVGRPAGVQHLLEMVVDDLGVTRAASLLHMSVRRARGLLIRAVELWPELLSEVKDDVGEREWMDVYVKLAS